jgi:hypothetical protein
MARRPALRRYFAFGTLSTVLMRASVRRLVLAVWAFMCAAVLTVSLWPTPELVRTEDQNHDGRPDLWRFYDRQGRLTRVEIDTNFDGRTDHRDYYRDGSLTRSESDRNFDNRIDLIEEFDRTGRQHVRSVVDANFDGAADLLVLFQDGKPVHSEWATPAPEALAHYARPIREAAEPLTPFEDPFGANATLRAHHRARAPDIVGMTPASLTLDVPIPQLTLTTFSCSRIAPAIAQRPRSTTLLALPGRAPPRALRG